MEPFFGTREEPKSCEDCLYYQDCYNDSRWELYDDLEDYRGEEPDDEEGDES